MKFNKWTLGLAAVGAVSLASAARADETKMSQVQTALSNTTISGYVDTSIQWNPGTGNLDVAPVAFQNSTKADGFNLNVVDLAIDHPEDESPWASGYHVELWFGPDANLLGTDSNPYHNPYVGSYGTYQSGYYYYGNEGADDFAIRQAYVSLRTPIANTGIDWKLGVFDSPLGYESTSSPSNPNYTHSYGYTIEPTELTGLEGTYKVNDMLSVTAGIANTAGAMINQRPFIGYYGDYETYYTAKAESYKAYFGAVTLTAPDSWGWLAGSTATAGVLNGYNPGLSYYGGTQTSWYLGGTLSTPVKGLKVGGALDYLNVGGTYAGDYGYYTWTAALYGSYQFNDKLSLNVRGDYWNNWYDEWDGGFNKLWSMTGDLQYNLWANVITRLEIRWDHAEHGTPFGGTVPYYENDDGYGYNEYDGTGASKSNAFMLALQVIYQF